MHRRELVHRDVKPDNIFIHENGGLVLGDFGLVMGLEVSSRPTGTFDNAGSRDWMPPWNYGEREDIRPVFDVFSLGKVIWAMISGRPHLRLWYLSKDKYNLENSFPEAPEMPLVNQLLAKCVVEHEEDCIPTIDAFIEQLDLTTRKIERNASILSKKITRLCTVCCDGQYELSIDRELTRIQNFGLEAKGNQSFRIYTCSNCGHVQLFSCLPKSLPKGWSE